MNIMKTLTPDEYGFLRSVASREPFEKADVQRVFDMGLVVESPTGPLLTNTGRLMFFYAARVEFLEAELGVTPPGKG